MDGSNCEGTGKRHMRETKHKNTGDNGQRTRKSSRNTEKLKTRSRVYWALILQSSQDLCRTGD